MPPLRWSGRTTTVAPSRRSRTLRRACDPRWRSAARGCRASSRCGCTGINATLALTPHQLKETWLNRALQSAGIDRRRWAPALGVEANRGTIEAVYGYYGGLQGRPPRQPQRHAANPGARLEVAGPARSP